MGQRPPPAEAGEWTLQGLDQSKPAWGWGVTGESDEFPGKRRKRGKRGGCRGDPEGRGQLAAGPRLTPSARLLPSVITLLIFLRRRLRKQARAQGKSTLEIHEQLVTYDEEGGGEMDTTSYDVSVLNSARHRGAKPPRPGRDVPPAVYAQVQKPPRHMPLVRHGEPGDMAAVIEVKKDEADHDSSALPYDTLHLFDYEGSESIAESLSSLGTHSSNSDIDYDFLNDWGPRFKMLAELYSTDSREELGY